ncbi:MAG: hypothetical protein ACFFAU_17800 [Candidatus Hodarchaeota archaeon]
MSPEGKKNHGVLFFILILTFILSSVGIRSSMNTVYQEDLDFTEIFPSYSVVSNQILSTSTKQQQNILSYLEGSWNLTELVENDLTGAVEIICKTIVAFSSVPSSSNLELLIYDAFDSILSSNMGNSRETLEMSINGLFYIWDGIKKNVSTSLNLWITKALLLGYKTHFPTYIDTIYSLLIALNQTSRGNVFFREFVLIDFEDKPIPSSISSIARLNDQLNVMILIKRLIPEISNETRILELNDLSLQLEQRIFDPLLGFSEANLVEEFDLSFGFFHSKKNQDLNGNFYSDLNKSYSLFEDNILLLEFLFHQIKDYSIENSSGFFDLYDPILANNYVSYLINLMSDIQILFQHETTQYHEKISINNITRTETQSDRLYIGDQFNFIKLLCQIVEWFSFQSTISGRQIYSDQFQEILIPLWEYISEEAYIQVSEVNDGIASTEANISSISGYFFAFYSISLGLYLFDNTTKGSLLFANILSLGGLGSIFPFKLSIEYTNPLNVGESQNLSIKISPISTNKTIRSSGLYLNTLLFLSVPVERIDNTLIYSTSISVFSNTSTIYKYTISAEGSAKFFLSLFYKNALFFNLEGSYLVLKPMFLNISINPVIPTQGGQMTISLQVRDNKGILRSGIQYFAKIQSNSWKNPIVINNRSLFQNNGTINVIFLDSDQTKSDITCYFAVTKNGYYPAEVNTTIHLQTSLNFLFNFLKWLIFESEIGAYLGSISAIFAIFYAVYSRIFSRMTGRYKTCHFCGEMWRTKYPVCSHCGRELKEGRIRKIENSDHYNDNKRD